MDRLSVKIVLLSLVYAATQANREDDFYNDYKEAIEFLDGQNGTGLVSCDLFEWSNEKAVEYLQNQYDDNGIHGANIQENTGAEFNCELFENPGPAATVNELTPYDIAVVGAMGDSITAAFGANAESIAQIIEYRGVSWSIGGDEVLEEVGTLPNIIKKYNPDVKGFSLYQGDVNSSTSFLNVAVSGSIAQDMPGQARELIRRIREDQDIDFNNDWKVVTLFIGGNNLCKYCLDREYHSVGNYYGNVTNALDILHAELPRTFVNLVQIFDVSVMVPLKKTTLVCCVVHWIACPCAGTLQTTLASVGYQKSLEALVESGRYEEDDFTVVIQPLLTKMEIPVKDDGSNEPDESYFAPDCFHFSGKGHKEAAVALWNNMVQPIGSKQTEWELNGPIVCPTQDAPYFYTKNNSNQAVVPLPGRWPH